MTRQSSRVPSPTATSLSGTSNYFTDSDRSVQVSTRASSAPVIDYSQSSRTHYTELGKYLARYLAENPFGSRSEPISKLTELSDTHFHELSTDVYDEIIRRNMRNEVLFLPTRKEFHVKRNKARHKMSTMTTDRLEGMSSEIFFEVERRYPELKGETEFMSMKLPLKEEDDEVIGDQKVIHGIDARLHQPDKEFTGTSKHVEEPSLSMQTIQNELERLRQISQLQVLQAQNQQGELATFRERCIGLEREKVLLHQELESEKVQRKTVVEGLETKIKDLSTQNAQLIIAKDSDSVTIHSLEDELKEYKGKFEQAKADLENLRATSHTLPQAQAPKLDDEDDQVLIMASESDVPDIHIGGFVSAINKLHDAGRSNQSRHVLAAAICAADAVENIIQDINTFERRFSGERSGDINLPALLSLRDRAKENISDLVAAAKKHASNSGMSPISSLKATARHTSFTITEIERTFYIPQAAKVEESPSTSAAHARYFRSRAPWPAAVLRPMSESQTASTASSRNASQFSTSSGGVRAFGSMLDLNLDQRFGMQWSWSGNGSSEQAGSPIRISIAMSSDDSEPAEKSEATSGVFQPYLEDQTESMNVAIENLLSGVNSPIARPPLTEKLSEIIKIASDVIDTYDTNFPPSATRGIDIIRGLRDHANKLRKIQALPEVSKERESWQTMAKSSFAIMDAMKDLLKP